MQDVFEVLKYDWSQVVYRYLIVFMFCSLSFLEVSADQWNGADYAQNSSVQLSHAERLLQAMSLQGDERILDIGCGDGKITALLSKMIPQGAVIGIDPSISMITKAREILKKRELFNLSFCEGSAEDFSLDEQFDHIMAIHVMHWIKDQEVALKNMYDHLKPTGHVHLILAPSKEELPFHKALQKTCNMWSEDFERFINPQQVYDIETYRKLMVAAGFHIEVIHYVYHESIHETKEKLRDWVRQWLPHGKHLPVAKQDAFLDELINNYMIEAGFSQEISSPVRWGEYVLIMEASRT